MLTEKEKQILSLLKESKDGYNINQIAKLTKTSASWTHETLKKLEKQAHLKAKQLGNAVFYTLNQENAITKKFIEILELENGKTIQKEQVKTIEEKPQEQKYQNITPTNHITYNTANNSTQQGNIYRTATAQFSGYSVAKVNDVQGMLFAYAATGSGGLGYSQGNTFSGENAHYGSTGAPPIDTLSGKISKSTTGFTFSTHTVQHNSSNVPGCRYCGPTVTI